MSQRIPAIAQVIAIHAAAATTQTDNFTLQANDYDSIAIEVTCSAASGTSPTLDVYVQCQDSQGNWRDVVHMGQVTAVLTNPLYAEVSSGDSERYIGAVGSATVAAGSLGVPILNNNLRVYSVIGGTTPSFTYTVTAYICNQSPRS